MIEPIEMNVDFSTQDTEMNVEADMNCKVEIPLPIASATTLGGIKVGENLSITEDGTMSADANADDVDQLKNALTAIEIIDSASGAIASFADGSNGVPVNGLKVQLEPIQAGSGDPSPTNIRPISGRDSVTVTRTWVNIWDEEWEVGGLSTSTGAVESDAAKIRSKNFCACKPGTTYRKVRVNAATYVWFYDIEKNYISYTISDTTFTTPDNCYYFKLRIGDNAHQQTTYNHDISINYPSTDTDYHAGHVQTVEIPLGQTVYGGTLDVTTGVLTVTMAEVDLGTLNWTRITAYTNPLFHVGIADKLNSSINILTSIYANGGLITGTSTLNNMADNTIGSGDNANTIYVRDDSCSDVNALKSKLNGVYLVYELANPVTVQLTAQQMTTLLGQNNVWSDADSVSVDYVADTKLYIEQLTEPDADMIADMNITSGRYFMVGNSLYLATANIANGAAITVGVNCTKTSLAEALNAINS